MHMTFLQCDLNVVNSLYFQFTILICTAKKYEHHILFLLRADQDEQHCNDVTHLVQANKCTPHIQLPKPINGITP